MLKDYYKILGVPPNAGPGEIKKSFRQLAMLYHPDMHEEDEPAMARFMEIHEAYDTLMDPDKKEIYLQKRWYEQSMGRKLGGHGTLSPEEILMEAVRLNRYASTLNPFRTDLEGLLEYQLKLFDMENITTLRKSDNQAIAAELVRLSLDTGKHFRLPHAVRLIPVLQQLVSDQSEIYRQTENFLSERSQKEFWEKWRIPMFLIITALICYLIFRAGK